ncbi:MAG: transglycosylase SLT domain-containing protein [Alphaproteobacteria bacterium]|nr:transglycosylase SLT domain-containing protein [Alphaproteobacteria bacterium]
MIVEPTGSNSTVTGAIRQAARMTGADFKYLLATAQVESNLNPNAQASTSSARGLFQFTEQTWLTTVKEQGAAFGYGPYANAITRQPSGEYAISDPRMTGAVMNLRSDATANALMAGAFTKSNGEKLAGRLGRNPTEGELYIAHFLGSAGASRMIALADSRPETPAAAVFPGAARANPSIFYDGRGNARSTGDVYRVLVGRYDVARSTPSVPPAVPSGPSPQLAEAAPAAPRAAFAPDTASLTETYAAAARMSPAKSAVDMAPVFHGLFRSTGGPEPVAPLVNSLWTSPPSPAGAPLAGTAAPTAPVAVDNDLGLFQDTAPDARALFRGRV